MSSISISPGGLVSAQDRFDSAAQRVAKQGSSPQDFIEMENARNSAGFHASVIHVIDQMTKSTIDLVG